MKQVVVWALLCGVGCSAAGGSALDEDDGPAGSGAAQVDPSGGGGSAGVDLAAGGSGGGDNEGGGCVAVSSEATLEVAPADIIVAVDTSGSMNAEAQWTQDALPSFVAAIAQSGIDAQVVLIASDAMCVPPPMGSGSCGCNDSALPGYRHVCTEVGSNDALAKILATYGAWSASLRPGASKTFAVITDDDSDMSAAAFSAQLPLTDPTLVPFKFDAIAASAEPWVPGNCFLLSAAKGDVYIELATQTQGVFGDLCNQSFAPVFQDMATAVIAGSQIGCEITIPPPPLGETLDPAEVNVAFSQPNQPAQPLYNVPTAADCQGGGWYYNNPAQPTQIILCPDTCNAIQGVVGGKIDVLFGCATEVGPPR